MKKCCMTCIHRMRGNPPVFFVCSVKNVPTGVALETYCKDREFWRGR
jgi:hypothetical protein